MSSEAVAALTEAVRQLSQHLEEAWERMDALEAGHAALEANLDAAVSGLQLQVTRLAERGRP